MANSRLVFAEGGFQKKLRAYNERRGVNLKLCLKLILKLRKVVFKRSYVLVTKGEG